MALPDLTRSCRFQSLSLSDAELVEIRYAIKIIQGFFKTASENKTRYLSGAGFIFLRNADHHDS